MKKLILVVALFALTFFVGTPVFAEEVAEVVEPNAWDNWVSVMGDFASFKNFIVTSGSLAGLVALLKLRGAWKYFKSPQGMVTIEKIGFNILSKVTDSPELVIKISKLVMTMPVIKGILDKAQRKGELYELELQGKILDMEAKLSAQIFEGTAQQEAIEYLTKMRTEYEAIKLNE